MSGHYKAKTALGRAVNEIEETLIAVLLGLMTVITFINVVARYVFNANVLWALETTVFLFAWLVLFGISYCVKISAHLGVDALVNIFSPPVRKALTLVALVLCLVYCALLLKGSWDYWAKFYFQLSFMEVDDVPFPHWMQSLLGMQDGSDYLYDYLPRYIPYFILPLGMVLMTFRLLQAGWRIWTGEQTLLIASHEVEDQIEAAAETAKGR